MVNLNFQIESNLGETKYQCQFYQVSPFSVLVMEDLMV